MPIFAQSENEIIGDILYEVVNGTNITRSSPGSKLRALAQATGKKMGRMWGQFDLNFIQAYLDGAEGEYLNFIGSMMNTPRLGETIAAVAASEKVVKFYLTTGVNFGSINGGGSITIPAGETVGTQAGGTGIVYRLPYAVVLPSTESEVYITVEAVYSGERSNIGVSQLKYHSFTNYTDSSNDSLLVTNESEIISGNEIESDSNYRYRIGNANLVAEKANETACRLAGLIVPGVADIITLPYFNGIGSFDMIVQAIAPTTPDTLVNAVKESVLKTKGQGIVPYVRAPYQVGISVDARIRLKSRTSSTEEDGILSASRINVADYINNLEIGEEFIYNEVIERILGTSPVIKDLGDPNEPIDEMRVSLPSRIDDTPTTSVLLANYTPEADEKIYADTVNLTIAP